MDALHPRLLVDNFAECFTFYQAVLPKLVNATLMKGTEAGPYANWDVDDQAILVLMARAAITGVAGTTDLPVANTAAQDGYMFVLRVDDVDAGFTLCVESGAVPVAMPTDRPDWGPNLRTAHVRDPHGTLLELQSY
ncbi:VOC family protein [Nocardia sp. CDC160]|uniref:VOC family protein n=1 Tax=Nocardia sp. CDC160 TaxID=3112166 RepID=UPI002DBBD93F|nr:VOC family protein [Nocardia sp. CDC160]MEC3919214.1 VOC family protein [Nocardia sp. CDC160]